MQNLPALNNGQTISTLDLRAKINEFREAAGENPMQNNHFITRIEDEIEHELPSVKLLQSSKGGSPAKFYELTQEQALLVGMRESKVVRRKVLGWLKTLQTKQPALPDFNDPVASARAWADEVEEKRAAIVLLEQQKPAVEFVQKYVEADSLKGFREVCKLLNANERDFRQFLVEQKIVYRLGGAWTAYKPHIEAGRMDTKAATANGKTFNQIMFTAKGITWIAEKWGEFNK